MRLLLVNWQDRENPQAGGAEQHLHEIFGRIAARGHEVTLLCSGWPGCTPRATVDGMDVHRVGTRYTFPFFAHRYYSRRLAGAGHDVLIEDINKIPLYTPRWGARRSMVVVPHLFGTTVFQEAPLPLATAVWLAERPLARVYSGLPFEAISESTADDLAARGIPRESVRVIYCGIDSRRYTPDPAQRSPDPLFAYLGRLRRYKGVDIVLRAFAALGRPDARLEIAGTGDHRPALERLARSLDLGDRVRFLGFISEAEKLALLRRAWALAFASPKEGWGITNLEAAACATPVVASNSPGIRESVRDGETGILVPHGDVAAMSRALAEIAGSRELVERLGTNGRRFAEGFTWDRAADETEAHLHEVIARHA
ncbi:MAG TPA: glycosyltransferase family 4 protein [Gemmatimonadaceae bacterium]|nr:glycosyltransferase family 4 protein [Gemmatimonadaceae bacterium]